MPRTKIQVGNESREFIVMQTTAPESYDYGGVLYIEDGYDAGTQAEVRIVLVPDDMRTVCEGRYGSGLYSFKEAEDWLLDVVEEKIWEKIFAKEKKDAE